MAPTASASSHRCPPIRYTLLRVPSMPGSLFPAASVSVVRILPETTQKSRRMYSKTFTLRIKTTPRLSLESQAGDPLSVTQHHALFNYSPSNFFPQCGHLVSLLAWFISPTNPAPKIAVGKANIPIPRIAITDAISLPKSVTGKTSPYPTVVNVVTAHHIAAGILEKASG